MTARATTDKDRLLTCLFIEYDRVKTTQMQFASGGCDGDKKDNKESQKQNQSHAQETGGREGNAQKVGNNPKKAGKNDGEKGGSSINSQQGKAAQDRRQAEANRRTGACSDEIDAEPPGNADFVRATYRRRHPLLQSPFSRRYAARTRCDAASW
jgi:hypothetical protein